MRSKPLARQRPSSELRLADLLDPSRTAGRLMNLKVPTALFQKIADIAKDLGASKTDVVVALLNAGLDSARQRLPQRPS